MFAPRHYLRIAPELFERLEVHLSQGNSVAVLGPRGTGKGFVVRELVRRANRVGCRPIELDLLGLKECTPEELIQAVGRQVDSRTPKIEVGQRLSGILDSLLKAAALRDKAPRWIVVRGILEIPTSLARSVLETLQGCRENGIGVCITGTADFVPLTYGSNSPYRDVPQFILTGMDVGTTGAYVVSRQQSTTLIGNVEVFAQQIDVHLDMESLHYLHDCTDGYMHLVEEVILAAKRHPVPEMAKNMERRWTKPLVQKLVENYFDHHIENDLFLREALRSAQQYPQGFDTLLRLHECSGAPQTLPQRTGSVDEYDLEVGGIVRKLEGSDLVTFASPLWHRYFGKVVSSLFVADTYAVQKRWDRAWSKYNELSAVQRDRPATGDADFRWNATLACWENSFVGMAAEKGPEVVYKHFLSGLRYLFGFDAGGVYDVSQDPPQPLFVHSAAKTLLNGGASEALLALGQASAPPYSTCDETPPWRDGTLMRVRYDFTAERNSLPSYPDPQFRPVLLLERLGADRLVDSALRRVLRRAADAFWVALSRADRNQYHATLLLLHRKHAEVIRLLKVDLARGPFEMGQFMVRAAELLVEVGGYLRVQFCLVDARRENISYVVSRAQGGEAPIDFPTEMPLSNGTRPEFWDVQHWVVRHKRQCIVANASDPHFPPDGPTTQWEKCSALGMQAIAIVPLLENGEVLGTLHVERTDKKPPPKAEQELLDILGAELALAFAQAKRMTLLQGAINNLPDEVRILNRQKEIVFQNSASAAAYGGTAGWLNDPVAYRGYRCAAGAEFNSLTDELVQEVERANETPVHRLNRDKARNTVEDWQLVPIRTFEESLPPPFAGGDWLDGHVERVNNLSGFYQLYTSVNHWLTQADKESTAACILEYFQKTNRYRWCRIYTIEPSDDGEVLKSYRQYGLEQRANVRRFEDGGLVFNTKAIDQYGWHLFRHKTSLALCRHDNNLLKDRAVFDDSRGGFPELRINERTLCRQWLEKDAVRDLVWIEAPLEVGENRIGLVSLAMPGGPSLPELISPLDWELLQWTFLGVGIALHNAKRKEEEAARGRQEGWKLAASLAVHQLTNKVLPIESFLDYIARRSVALTPYEQESLGWARESMLLVKAILRDFRRYASDKPFTDAQLIPIPRLLTELVRCSRAADHNIGRFAADVEGAPNVSVSVSLEACREILEIFLLNSVLHGGKNDPQDLYVRLEAVRVSRPFERDPSLGGGWVRLIFTDNGVGVPEDRKKLIFEPFHSTNARGTGLGLAIAKQFVLRQGGCLIEDGVYTEGACFSIYLPIAVSPKGPER